ncbi:MAG: GNAT family N-acetyltransferase [Chloroflexi bacterium]|nr:GNAT family N-acetyltransferase [Chloroflexota bacterium]
MEENRANKTPESVAPLFNIVGERVALGPLRKDLAPYCNRWYNDLRTMSRLGDTDVPWTLEQEEQRYEKLIARNETEIVFLIYERSSGHPIGITGLDEVDKRNRTAEFGISIGEPDARGKGYGTETTQLVLDYAFTGLGLHNVLLTVFEYNLPAIRAYTKAGFNEFGRRRESIFMGGRLWDIIYMECLSTEWGPSPVLAQVFKPDEPR